ncbi:hypothetical protein GCM10008961_22420 [Deinococcus knuensis]|uniref:Uncharacterized protein n=1 Tax=Deinococcus knuensis TaxID=1837380 RepID=A0ABQ2SI25_9DEIO|nr:hypothetical protein GCM10008961_22420 [Deinococcus knuensis]
MTAVRAAPGAGLAAFLGSCGPSFAAGFGVGGVRPGRGAVAAAFAVRFPPVPLLPDALLPAPLWLAVALPAFTLVCAGEAGARAWVGAAA